MSEIEFKKCESCNTIQFKERKRCKKCKSFDLKPYMCKPSGKVITHTSCSALPESIKHHKKVTFAIIDLDCGGRILAQIWPLESVDIGARVIGHLGVVSKQEGEEEISDWIFSPQNEI